IVHQVQPGIPAGIRSRIHGTIVVPVEVDVNAAGKVTRSSADRRGDGLYQYLADQALQAARLWSFEPARTKNGRRVEGEKTIYFVFKN
ncbi:MAG TPA: TonB family protein, partial [Bryobacteraceae bacterium]|nr:TonB family protein [Bryobacteraceae bacterium]